MNVKGLEEDPMLARIMIISVLMLIENMLAIFIANNQFIVFSLFIFLFIECKNYPNRGMRAQHSFTVQYVSWAFSYAKIPNALTAK